MDEGPKRTLFLYGRKRSNIVKSFMRDLHVFKKPDAFMCKRNNDVTIFENVVPVEQMCKKFETPLFVLGSHSKKRPHNLVLGRMFDYALLDMVELGIETYTGIDEFVGPKISLGTKPLLIFSGIEWTEKEELKQLKSMFIDMFHREKVLSVRLQGLEHVISFAVKDGKVLMRTYKVLLKKSGCRTPRIELDEIGKFEFCLVVMFGKSAA